MPIYVNGGSSALGALIYQGAIDCSGNPNYPAALKGDVYIVSAAGKIGGASGAAVDIGDMLVCKTDTVAGTHATVGANWDIVQSSAYSLTFDGTVNVGDIIKKSGTTTLGTATYTNATPVPVTIGGITAGKTFAAEQIPTVLNELLYPYIAPGVVLSSSPSATLREYGDTVVTVDLSATTTKHTNNITSVLFKRGVATIHTVPAPIAGGGVETFTETNPISAADTFTATAGDGTTTTTSNTLTFSFCYPFFYGVGAAGLTGAQIYATLTKIIQNKVNSTKAFAPTNQYYYFAYPSSYGALSAILDQNGFNITADFTVHDPVSITGLDSTPQNYRVYEFNNLTSLSQNLTFNF